MTALLFLLATSQGVAVETGLPPSGEDFGLLVFFLRVFPSLYFFFFRLFNILVILTIRSFTPSIQLMYLHVRFTKFLLDGQ